MIQLKLLFMITVMTFINLICQNEINEKYEELITTINNLEKDGQYKEVLTLVNIELKKFPEKEFELMKEIEFLNTKLEKYSDNLALWKKAHQKGYFFLLNKGMKKYTPYLQFKEFESVFETDRLLRENALLKSKTKYELTKPNIYTDSVNYPLLIVLHGGGSNFHKVKQRWKIIPELMDHYYLLFVQSYRHYDYNTYGWSSTDERGYIEFVELLNKIVSENRIDTNNNIIGGTSAGATFSFGLLAKQLFPIKGLIAFCPGKPENFNIKNIISSTLKVFIVAGANDYYLPKQKELINLLRKNKIRYKYKIIPEMGHEFPKSYNTEIMEAFEFIQTN